MPESAAIDCCDTAGALGVGVARARMLAAVDPLTATETVPLHAALGRTLARRIRAIADSPPADNSAMDGYAVRLADLEAAEGVLPVSQRIPAGMYPEPLALGTAARIFTGGIIPDGAEAVIMQEHCREDDGMVHVDGQVRADDNIRRAGEDLRAGSEVLAPGRHLRAQHLGMAATAGHGSVTTYRRARVAILVTGDELVSAGRPLSPGHIYNSNGPLLQGLVQALDCEVAALRHVHDTREATRDALESVAPNVDLILSSGGVSVGEEDHVRAAVETLGQLDFWKVSMKPGKPLAFGRVAGTRFLGFPGNPVSLFVTFALFGAPLLRRLQGRDDTFPRPTMLPADFARGHPGRREEYLRVRLEHGRLAAFPQQGSGVLSSVEWADGLAVVPAGAAVQRGDLLDYHGFGELFT